MAAFPAASTGTENALPAEKPSWRDRFLRLLCPAMCSLGILGVKILSKSLHECFDKLDQDFRQIVIRAWVIMATILVLALAVPPLLLVYFLGQQMAQVWLMAVALCFYVFFILFLCVWRNWRRYADFLLLSYGLLLVYFAAGVIGLPRTTVFFLHLTTAWAVGYLGYHLAVHRLHKGTEEDIEALPCPSISIGWFVVALLWTALTAAVSYGQSMTKALDIVFVLFYMGWIHAALWVARTAGELMLGVLLLFTNTEPLPQLPSLLVPCVIVSPFISLLSAFLSVLFQWLLLMALVAFLGYNLAPFTHTVQYTVQPHQPPSTRGHRLR